MDITGKNIIVFSKEYNGKTYYKAGMSTKNKDGAYEYAYIDLKVPKEVNLENKTKINITKGFLSFYNKKEENGVLKTNWYIVVQEYTKSENVIKVETITTDQLDSNMELPF